MSGRPLYHHHAHAYDALVAGSGPTVEWIAGVLPAGGRVIDAGCGTGRIAAELAARGFAVTGVDRSEELVAVARERAPDLDLVVADLTAFSPPGPVDAVLCRGVLNDLLADDERQAAVGAFARWLDGAGTVVLDVRDRDASLARYGGEGRTTTAAAGDLTFTSVTRAEPDGTLRCTERLGDTHFEFAMRPWSEAELRERAAAAGFARVELAAPEATGARADRLVALLAY